MPKVSAIIPTYNRAHFIGESIQSVLDQTFTDLELIIIDDGSTDNTGEVVNSFNDPRIRYIYQQNQGVSAASNAGINASSGEYISFLASDDLWLPRNIELKARHLDDNPEIMLICSDFYLVDGDTGEIISNFWKDRPYGYMLDAGEETRPIKRTLPFVSLINPITVMVRRSVYDEAGYFDESMKTGGEDWDMYIRILQRFYIGTINIPLAKNRIHPGQLSENTEEMYQANIKMLDKLSSRYSFSKEEKKFLRDKLARTHCKYGWSKVINSDKIALGRRKLLISIMTNPFDIKPYAYLALSLMGRRGIRKLKSWKK